MDALHGNIGRMYFKYLGAAFGSALICSVYWTVDMAAVGQYQGPAGTAALTLTAPLWSLLYGLGLMTGLGGGVLFSFSRGGGELRTAREYFTVASALTAALAFICTAAFAVFDEQMMAFFGADAELMPLARIYLLPVKFAAPFFTFNQMLAAFLRDDGRPGLATGGVLAGGIVNIAGDYLFVFPMGMGMFGAGLATSLGAVVTFFVMLTHFLSKKCDLRFARPTAFTAKARRVLTTGFSTFFADMATGVISLLLNRQILRYSGTDALAVYGILVNIAIIVQCCGAAAGQAGQPLISENLGAGQPDRVRKVLKCALAATAAFGVAWTAVTVASPDFWVRVFMTPTEGVLACAPSIMYVYSVSFLLLPFNFFSTYYFQAIMYPRVSFAVPFVRGFIISGALIILLPTLFGADALWLAMPLTEFLTASGVALMMRSLTKALFRRAAGRTSEA